MAAPPSPVRRGRRAAAWLALLVALAGATLVAVNWTTSQGWFATAGPARSITLLPSSPEDVAGARLQLAALALVPRPPSSKGYRRAAFGPAWTDIDNNGCNQRDDVLLRDVLTSAPYRVGRQHDCDHDLLSGSWIDPYTGTTITLTDAKAQGELVQIDHIVALSVAWRYGASDWTQERRLQFANDLRELVAVGGSANDAKGGADASQWRPVRAAQCGYAVRYVTVKAAYALPTDATEKRALADMLDTCD